MTDELIVALKELHPAQSEIFEKAKRFNHLRCGRRFGKTTLIEELASIALEGKRVGIWYPTSKDSSDVWIDLKYTYREVTEKCNEQLKQLRLWGGGIIDFWSMDEPMSGQGRKYHRAIIDEAAKAGKLYIAWEETIMPTLADYQGDAWIMSRPKGYSNGFYLIEAKHRNSERWAFFHYTMYDNPYIEREEVEIQKEELDTFAFEQECMAEYVDINSMPFLHQWDAKKHVKECPINETLSIRLSFDFNIDPFAVSIYQRDSNTINIIDKIRLGNSDIEQVCDAILSKYGEQQYIVTGDASGGARTGMVRGKRSYWEVIIQRLKIPRNDRSRILKRGKNLDLIESRNLCNLVLNHPRIGMFIDPKNEELIRDCGIAQVDEYGVLIKNRNKQKNDFLDTWRYICDAEFPDIIRKFKAY